MSQRVSNLPILNRFVVLVFMATYFYLLKLSELKFDHEEAIEKHKRDLMRLKSECGEKLSRIKETTSQEIALLQEELRQQQMIINDKSVVCYCYNVVAICYNLFY